MFTTGQVVRIALAAASACLLAGPVRADDPITPAQAAAAQEGVSKAAAPGVIGKLTVTVGKSLTIDSPLAIKRLSTANGNLVEAGFANTRNYIRTSPLGSDPYEITPFGSSGNFAQQRATRSGGRNSAAHDHARSGQWVCLAAARPQRVRCRRCRGGGRVFRESP